MALGISCIYSEGLVTLRHILKVLNYIFTKSENVCTAI